MIITDLIIIICLMLSAFFSGMEIAFVSSNKIYLEIEKQQSGINARLLSFITKNPSRFIATMLVGNNISLVIYGIFIGDRILQMMFPSTLQDLSFSIKIDGEILCAFTNFVFIIISAVMPSLTIPSLFSI